MADINSPWEDSTELTLPSNHPGLHDPDYLRRRKAFFFLAQDLRVRELPAPKIPYTAEEEVTWKEVYEQLDELHERAACAIFRAGKRKLGLSARTIPQLPDIGAPLFDITGVRLVPAEGLLHGKTYFNYWAKRIMPCTQFLRHGSEPRYTPEPDIIHDVIGHVPPLTDANYVRVIELIGRAAATLGPHELELLVRFYWFTVEFGLVEERDSLRVLGAGILSSIGETEHVLAGNAELRPFSLDEVLATEFDTTKLQPKLFVARSLEEVIDAAEVLLKRFEERAKRKAA